MLEIQHRSNFADALGALSMRGAGVDPDTLPLLALLSTSWVPALATSLRCCQATTGLERMEQIKYAVPERSSGISVIFG